MKNWMKVFAPTAFAAIGCVTLAASAYGQGFPVVATNCEVIADEVVVDGQPFTSAGTMDLSPGEVSPASEPIDWMALVNDGFSAQSEDPVLGTITWELDEDRPVTTSIIRSNQEDEVFPATVQLDFNVRATISSRPGVFLSRTPISISSADVMSWPPGELVLSSTAGVEVEFFNEATGETAFIVNRLSSTVRD